MGGEGQGPRSQVPEAEQVGQQSDEYPLPLRGLGIGTEVSWLQMGLAGPGMWSGPRRSFAALGGHPVSC